MTRKRYTNLVINGISKMYDQCNFAKFGMSKGDLLKKAREGVRNPSQAHRSYQERWEELRAWQPKFFQQVK